MEYIILGILVLLATVVAIYKASLSSSRLKTKNSLINALIKVCIKMKADPELVAMLKKRGHELDDEDLLIRVNSWLFTDSKHKKQLSGSLKNYN
ncbi:hypothetical protein [Larkinella arboricola]|uniref:Uncharacterized protein n=1 Tax=Larkinella arboricola TaxID=643671 RepID=A0A327WU83_LARAB|nr:hypothetical protein [Larkinella arboricola]RAJ92300.1 hypothetical protein LX87_05269 [Larkinella arboricola]